MMSVGQAKKKGAALAAAGAEEEGGSFCAYAGAVRVGNASPQRTGCMLANPTKMLFFRGTMRLDARVPCPIPVRAIKRDATRDPRSANSVQRGLRAAPSAEMDPSRAPRHRTLAHSVAAEPRWPSCSWNPGRYLRAAGAERKHKRCRFSTAAVGDVPFSGRRARRIELVTGGYRMVRNVGCACDRSVAGQC